MNLSVIAVHLWDWWCTKGKGKVNRYDEEMRNEAVLSHLFLSLTIPCLVHSLQSLALRFARNNGGRREGQEKKNERWGKALPNNSQRQMRWRMKGLAVWSFPVYCLSSSPYHRWHDRVTVGTDGVERDGIPSPNRVTANRLEAEVGNEEGMRDGEAGGEKEK